MFALCAFLSFLFVSQSASLSCDELIRPMDNFDQHHLQGTWAMVAGSLSHSASLEALKTRESITINFSNTSQTTSTYTQINRISQQCQSLEYDVSIVNSTIVFNVGGRFNLSGAFLYTSCPDCVVMRWDVESKRRVSLDAYLISRRREVAAEEMEEFRDQLRCLGLPPPVEMDPTMELCPGEALTTAPPS